MDNFQQLQSLGVWDAGSSWETEDGNWHRREDRSLPLPVRKGGQFAEQLATIQWHSPDIFLR